MLNQPISRGSSENLEDGCRRFYLTSDIKQTRIAAALFAIPFCIFMYNDYLFFKFSAEFYALAALRLAVLAGLGFEFFFLAKIHSYRFYDKIVFASALCSILAGGVINLSRLDSYMPQVILAVIAVFGLYLAVPFKFLYQGILATVTSAGEVVLVLLAKPAMSLQMYTLFTAVILANLIGAFISWQIHTYRKKTYQELALGQKLQLDLQQQTQRLEKTVSERTEQLKKAERMAAIGENAGMLGHDLRNPLTGISNASYLLKKNYASQLDDRGLEMLKVIDENTAYSNQIIGNLLDYSRNLNLNLAPADVGKLVRDALGRVALNPTIKVDDAAGMLPNVVVDGDALRRVFFNILNNAVEAMPQGGTLTLRTEKANDVIRVSIGDTGAGISEENQKRLFQPLFTTKSGGTGFGLAICKKIVEAHRGRIYVQSALNEGTTFTVELPLQAAQN